MMLLARGILPCRFLWKHKTIIYCLDSARQLNIDQNLTAGKTITLNANGGIVQKQGTTFTSGTNTTDPEGGNITITNKGSGNITLDNVVA